MKIETLGKYKIVANHKFENDNNEHYYWDVVTNDEHEDRIERVPFGDLAYLEAKYKKELA